MYLLFFKYLETLFSHFLQDGATFLSPHIAYF